MKSKVYTYEQALQGAVEYFGGDELSAKVFTDKYCLRAVNGDILEDTPEKMHWRIANEFARIEAKKFKKPMSAADIFGLIDRFKYVVPQGSPMFGIGNDNQIISLSNCFLLDVPLDSYSSILQVDEQLVNISKRRGGVGIDLSNLRPAGTVTRNAARQSTGIVTWMERYSNSIREVGQGGRRGALMLTLSVHHPDILPFCTVKNDPSKVTGANISVRLTREFLDAVKKDKNYEIRFPVDYKERGIEPTFTKKISAKEVWDTIINCAWLRAEPGLLMWDNVVENTPADCYEEFKSKGTNPCVRGDTLILTKNGEVRIDSVIGREVEVWNGYEWSSVVPRITGKNQSMIKVTLVDGRSLTCTHRHKWLVPTLVPALMGEYRKEDADLLVEGQSIWQPNGEAGVASVENVGVDEFVYCFTEPLRNLATFNGIVTGNCSEINLSPLDSCRLLCVNLLSYVTDPFTEKAAFDFTLFRSHAKLAQRLMDDLVDLESEKIDRIIEKVTSDPEPENVKRNEIALWTKIKKLNDEGRRTGTGITALGDTLAALGIKYGSKESIQMTEQIYKTLKFGCYESSVDMAEEIGAFKAYDSKAEENCPFIQRIAAEEPELYARMIKSGRRNISLTTTAPTGSVSLMTQTTSGIEPLFMTGYTRRKKINPNDRGARVDFVDDNGDSWQEFVVYHPTVKKWMAVTSKSDIKDSPWYGCCAEDINWTDRVMLQAAAQKHVCHAISSTINLPESVTKAKVAEIYQTAFENGLKGITVYRKNCRSGVMVETKQAENKRGEKIVKTIAPKRPQRVPGELHHFVIKGHRYFVAVGLLDGDPYEMFGGSNNDPEGEPIIPKTVSSGVIIKHERGKYGLKSGESEYSIVGHHSDANIDALTRMISTALRHGADISFVVHQLEKTKGEMQSFAKILARTLKKYIKDGTKVSGEKCPECKRDDCKIVREDGCIKCVTCGWSKCG